jgi:hypothetical protein
VLEILSREQRQRPTAGQWHNPLLRGILHSFVLPSALGGPALTAGFGLKEKAFAQGGRLFYSF